MIFLQWTLQTADVFFSPSGGLLMSSKEVTKTFPQCALAFRVIGHTRVRQKDVTWHLLIICGLAYYIFRSSISLQLLLQLRRLRVLIIWIVLNNPSFSSPLFATLYLSLYTMHETRRLVEAAAALSLLLQNPGIPHAFYGNVVSALLANTPWSDASIISYQTQAWLSTLTCPSLQEILCIVEGGQNHSHPFRRTRDAIAGSEDFTVTHSPWTNRWVMTVIIYFLPQRSLQSGYMSRIVVWFRLSK